MIGKRLSDRYEVVAEIGRGGMGVVYLAKDPLLHREVAIKVITPSLLSSEVEARFRREARLVAQMDHPAIVSVHDTGQHEGSLYIVMPYVKGANLRHPMNEGSLTLGDLLDIGIQTAQALDYSHSLGVVHRDIKPENILISQQGAEFRVRVTDFGLAMASTESRLTQSGGLVGTLSYLSPEQLSGEEVDGRCDLYALGTIFYECISGRAPFSGDIDSVLYRLVHEIPQAPRSFNAAVQEELEVIILRCLEKDPAKRFQRARDLADALSRYRSKLQKNERAQKISLEHQLTGEIRRPALSELIGRANELNELQHRLRAAIAGECQFAVVAGETGIGKTRLLAELENLAGVKKIQVLHGRFVEENEAFPYHGFCDLIQEFFRSKAAAAVDFFDLGPDLVSLFPMLKEIEGIRSTLSGEFTPGSRIGSKTSEDRTYIYELLARSLIRIAAGKPLVLLLEDLHAADFSVDALQYVVRRLGPTPTLIVATYRTTEVLRRHPIIRMLDSFHGDRRYLFLLLEPFLPSEHRAFLDTLTGSSDLEPGLPEKIYEATEGNPYFTKELVRSLMESGSMIQSESGAWRLSDESAVLSESLPATIQDTVRKRIERLPKNLRETLSAASILGRTFDLRDLVMLLGKKEKVETAIEQLAQEAFIEEERESRGGRFAFASGVVRDFLYSSLSKTKRKSLHRKYAEELEKRNSGRLERVYPQLMHHYLQGNVPQKVFEHGLKLAIKSLETSGAEDAIRAARIVLQVLEKEGEQNTLVEAQARILLAEGYRISENIEGTLGELEAAIRILDEQQEKPLILKSLVVSACLAAAEAAWEGRMIEETIRWVEKGLQRTRGGCQIGSLMRFLSLAATLANLRGEHEKAAEYMRELEEFVPVGKEKKEEIPRGGRLVAALSVPIQEMHPVRLQLDEEGEVIGNVIETLLSTDPNGNIVPCLCERWEVLEQGKSFLFTLRKGVKMHDGCQLTAQQIKKSFEDAVRLSQDNVFPAHAAIKGASKYLQGATDHIEGIVALSESRLQINLLEPLPLYPALLSDFRYGIARQNQAGSALVGTGPFKITSFQSNRVVLERNRDYWKAPPLLDVIEFVTAVNAPGMSSGFRSGEFDLARDVLPEDLESILRDRRLSASLVERPKKNTYFALINAFSPMASVRLALCGIPRTHDLVRSTLGRLARPAEGLFPPGILGHDPARRRTPLSREKAENLLGISGLSRPIPLRASVHPIFQDRYSSFLQALLKVWAEIGLVISIETPTMESFMECHTKNEKIDLVLSRWIADYDDPDTFAHGLFHSESGDLRKYYSSPELDSLIEQARTENQPQVREKLYRRMEKFLMESGYFLPLFHEIDYRIVSPKIKGLTLRSSPPYVNYAELGKLETPVSFGSRKGGVILVPDSGRIENLDPSRAYTITQSDALPFIFETLTRQTEGARIVPWLASAFQEEEGGRRYRFWLRDDIRFHDGRKLTARDVRYSFERLLQDRESGSRWLLSPILGAKDVIHEKSGELKGFQVVSALEFVIDLHQPVSFFPALLAHTPAAIVPEGERQFNDNWRNGCVGTGPFRIVRFDPGRRLELEANPDYWRQGYPRCDGLVFAFGVSPPEILSGFRSGRFSLAWNLLASDVEALKHESHLGYLYRETPRLSTYFAVLNIHRGPLRDEALRKKLMRTIEVEEVVNRNIKPLAIPAYSLIPPGLLGYEPVRPTTTPLMQQEQPELEIQLTTMVNSSYQDVYSVLAHELKPVRAKGFKVQIVDTKFEFADKADAATTVDLVLTRWIADYPDPDTFMHGLLHSETGYVGRFCGTPEIDRLVERGRYEMNPEIRRHLYREVEEILRERALLLPLFHEKAYCFARPEVEGFEVSFALQAVPYEKLWIRP